MQIEARNQIVEEHMGLINIVVSKIANRLPAHIDADDLHSVGVIGLMDAIDKFDESRGVLFKTYASHRVNGAILDHLRSLDWVPRTVRAKSRKLEAAYRAIEQQLSRAATPSEVADYMGLSLEDFSEMAEDARAINQISLDGTGADEDVSLLDSIENPGSVNPFEALGSSEDASGLAAAIGALPDKFRRAVSLHYFEDMTLKATGEVLGVSESRVSQMLTKARGLLQQNLVSTVN